MAGAEPPEVKRRSCGGAMMFALSDGPAPTASKPAAPDPGVALGAPAPTEGDKG